MIYRKFEYDFSAMKLDVAKIGHDLGAGEWEDREMLTGIIKEAVQEAAEIKGIRAEYRIFDRIHFHSGDQSLDIENYNFQIGSVLTKELRGSESVALFLCTAGEEISAKSRIAMNEGDVLKGYILDVIGSEIADCASELMQNELERAMAAIGKKITNRYSPGYCGWVVAEQPKLFALFPDNHCGIRLTHSSLMYPVKSVSGIIGTGSSVKFNPVVCDLCDQKNCSFRKKG